MGYAKDGVKHNVWINEEVIVSARAVESPKLLELPEIGSSRLLNKLGIKVVVNNGFCWTKLPKSPHVASGVSTLLIVLKILRSRTLTPIPD